MLEMPVGSFHAAVLVCDAEVIAGGGQAIMAAQLLIELGQGLPPLPSHVTISGTEAIGTMLLRDSTTDVQGILQALREGDEAFATLYGLHVLPTAVGQAVMVEQMLEGLTVDGDGDLFEAGEVGKPHPSGFMADLEHHLFGVAVQGFPLLHSPLQGALLALVLTGVTLDEVFVKRGRGQAGVAQQQGFEFLLPNLGEGVRTGTTLRLLLGGWLVFSGVDTAATGLGKSRNVCGFLLGAADFSGSLIHLGLIRINVLTGHWRYSLGKGCLQCFSSKGLDLMF